jgi:ribonuclease D
MDIITATSDLASLCNDLSADNFVAVDTEFMRESTFWPELCLIQIAGTTREAIIDPLAPGLDLAPFFELMANKKVVKVFHAARQDVEIIWILGKVIPTPMFDTQVAAMVCGFGDQIGYENLVRRLAKAEIDKSSRFTDWSRRPLSAKQLAYAMSDVTHLRVIYEKLKKELDESGREPWLEEEMAILTAPETYTSRPEDAWKRIKFRARNKKQVAVLMSVSAWRERDAQERNVPRSRVLKDDALTEIASQLPVTTETLRELRALPKGYAGSRIGDAILNAVKAGLNVDSVNIPAPADDRNQLTDAASAAAEVLRLVLKIVCETEGIAGKLIAGTSDLEAIAMDDAADVPAMRGWRRQVFGEAALKVKAGELGIVLKKGKARLVPMVKDARDLAAAE